MTRKVLYRHIFILLSALSLSCTDIIDTNDQIASDELLVVEGEITDEQGPYFVKLSTTSSLSGLGINTLGRGAEITIEDENGLKESLEEIEPGGTYRTVNPSFKGEIGKSYRLLVKLSNGNEYHSPFQTIVAPVQLSSFSAEFIEEEILIGDILNVFIGHELSATFLKEPGVNKFFRVEMDGVLEAEITFLDCPDPPPAIPVCYAFENPLQSQLVIFDDVDVALPQYRQNVVRIPATIKRRYLVEMILKSWSEETHSYWTAIKSQLDRVGSIFDAPIAPVIGNMTNTVTNERALGNFSAASVTRRKLCFDRSNELFRGIRVPASCTLNCIQLWAPATFDVPDGFNQCI